MSSGQFTYVSETRAEGRAEGSAKTILLVLKGRGIPVDDRSRERIESCADQTTLETWAERAGSVKSVEELFEG